MLYLLRSYGRGNSSLLKVGYASNLDSRLHQYRSHNPLVEVIGSRDGELVDEARLHLYFHALGYGCLMNEWYSNKEEVINIFEEYNTDKIDEYLWANRDNVFNFSDTREGSSQVKLYESLLGRFGKDLIVRETFDIASGVCVCSGYKIDREYQRKYGSGNSNVETIIIPEELKEFIENYNKYRVFEDRMKCICEMLNKDIIERNIDCLNSIISGRFLFYYFTLGPHKIRANSYHEGELKKINK